MRSRVFGLIGFVTLAFLLLPGSGAYSQGGSPESDRELADRLTDAAPVLDSRQSQLRSLEASGQVTYSEGRLAFRCWYEIPEKRACVVYHEDIPVFVAVGDQILAYGPLDGPVLLRGDWYVSFRVDRKDVALWWGVFNSGNTEARIEIDLKAPVEVMAAGPSAPERLERVVTPLGDKRFLLEIRTEGSTLEAWVDLSRTYPYSRLRGSDPKRVGFELHKLAVNEPVPAAAFRFPRFAETLNLTPTVVTLDKLGEIFQRVMVSMFTRFGLRSAEWRTKVDAQVSQPLDWERLRSRDAAIAPLLKGLVAEHEQLP